MALHRLGIFDALPPYHGGKRKLLGAIFKHLPGPEAAPVLADAFLGGGSVSLYAKARGYRVHCNDLATRSTLFGEALVANDRVTLAPDDLLRLFVPCDGNTHFMEKTHCPDVVTTRHARFLDNALAVAHETAGVKRPLLLALLVKYLYRLRPMGNFGAKSIVHQMEEGAWDEMNPAFVKDALVRGVTAHPHALAETLRRQLNRGVFAGAGPCTVSQLDAAAFLRAIEADVTVLDPPYGDQVLGYEKALRVVDEMLLGRRIEPDVSAFSKRGWQTALDDLLDAARHIGVVALTFGNASATLEELVALMRRHRADVRAESIAYVHCTGLAGADSRNTNREFILLGRH